MDLDRHCRIVGSQILVESTSGTEEIALSKCDTHAKILAWASYFLDRPAYKPTTIQRFIRLTCEHHKLSNRIS